MNLYEEGRPVWRMDAFHDAPKLHTQKPPCWFHRLMQRWLLGFRWVRE